MLNAREAAKKLGVSLPQFNRYPIRADVRMPNGTRLYLEETVDEFYEDHINPHREGISLDEIAKRYNVSWDLAYKWIVRKYDLPAIRTVSTKSYFRKKDVDRIAERLGWDGIR